MQLVLAQCLGMVVTAAKSSGLRIKLLDAVRQRDLLALREAVRDEWVNSSCCRGDVGIKR